MKQKLLKIIYKFLALCSRIYIGRNKIYTIGITGSVGKTTCRTVITEILKKFSGQNIYTSPKNYNSELGLVFSIFKIENYIPSIKNLFLLCGKIFFAALFGSKKYDVIVLEYGIDRPNDMDFLISVNKPDIAIFTKLDYTHSEFFPGGKQQVGDEKFKMLHAAKQKVYLNYSDKYCQNEYENIAGGKQYYWQSEDCKNYKLVSKGKSVVAEFETHGKRILTNGIGEANMFYIDLGLSILEDVTNHSLGQTILDDSIFLELSGQKARFNVLEGINSSILIDSTYNAGPESMKKIIADTKVLQQQLYPDYKLGFCLGDMREIGPESGKLHKEIYQVIQDSELIVVSNPEMTENFGDNAHKFTTSREAGKYLKGFLEETYDKYLILFKGSQNTVFVEEALIQLLKNVEDEEELCRQEEYWKKEKDQYFKKRV